MLPQKRLAKIKSLPKLAREKELEKLVAAEEEIIAATGQESEKKAKKWVDEDYLSAQKEQQEEEAQVLNRAEAKRKLPQIVDYTQFLTDYLKQELDGEDFPPGFYWRIFMPDKTKVRIDVFAKELNWRQARGFKISGIPKYDINACQRFALWAGVSARGEQASRNQTKSGLWLPN